MATGEHQLFEMALATTIKEIELSFPLKEEKKTALKAFLCKSLIYRLAPLVAGRSGIQLRAVIFSNACLVLRLELGHFHY